MYIISYFLNLVHPTGRVFRFGLQINKTKASFTFIYLVHPTGIEPISLVPETNVLSVELRVPTYDYTLKTVVLQFYRDVL